MWVLSLAVLAQATSGDVGMQVLTATGPAGVVALVLWKWVSSAEREKKELREETERLRVEAMQERDTLRGEVRQLTSRLFLLADRGMAVGQTASEVVASDEPALLAAMERVEALLEQRGRSDQ